MNASALVFKNLNNTDHRLAQHCTLEKTDQKTQYATKEAARFMSGPTRTAKCMLKRLCKYHSGAPTDIRAVTDANWAGELEELRSTSCGWIYFEDHLLEAYSSTQQIVALSTAESKYISITKVQLTLWRFAVLWWKYGMTFNVVCETDASVAGSCGCSSWAQKAWSKFEPGLESLENTTRQTWEQRWSI